MTEVTLRAARRGVDWVTQRIAISRDYPADGLWTVLNQWTIPMLHEAHETLDALEESREILREEADREAKANAKRGQK